MRAYFKHSTSPRRAYQIYPDDPSRFATIVCYRCVRFLPVWLSLVLSQARGCGFFSSKHRSLKRSEEREFKVQIPRKKRKKYESFSLFLSLGSVSIDSSYAMTRKAGGYLRELVSVRGRPESASEHAALLWILLSLREFLPIIKS